MRSVPRHPSDEERATASRPVLARCLTAAAAGDARALAACYAHDAVWLDDGSLDAGP